jgi:hypothetical protein
VYTIPIAIGITTSAFISNLFEVTLDLINFKSLNFHRVVKQLLKGCKDTEYLKSNKFWTILFYSFLL